MKFGKTLLESSTPEWRTQFIDYKRLKKALKPIKRRKQILLRRRLKALSKQQKLKQQQKQQQQQQQKQQSSNHSHHPHHSPEVNVLDHHDTISALNSNKYEREMNHLSRSSSISSSLAYHEQPSTITTSNIHNHNHNNHNNNDDDNNNNNNNNNNRITPSMLTTVDLGPPSPVMIDTTSNRFSRFFKNPFKKNSDEDDELSSDDDDDVDQVEMNENLNSESSGTATATMSKSRSLFASIAPFSYRNRTTQNSSRDNHHHHHSNVNTPRANSLEDDGGDDRKKRSSLLSPSALSLDEKLARKSRKLSFSFSDDDPNLSRILSQDMNSSSDGSISSQSHRFHGSSGSSSGSRVRDNEEEDDDNNTSSSAIPTIHIVPSVNSTCNLLSQEERDEIEQQDMDIEIDFPDTASDSTTTLGGTLSQSSSFSDDMHRITVTFENRIVSQISDVQKENMLYRNESAGFFDLLEKELDKINKFYLKTEKECAVRHTKLVKQIQIYHYNFKKKNILSKLGRHSTSKQMIMLGFQEHYRALVLLQNYRVLNFTGFTKIMKKYIKCSGNSLELKQEILSVIEDDPFYSSPMLNTLIEQAEDLATEHLHNGNRKNAMNSLRVPNEHFQEVVNQNVSFRCGLWLGISLILTGLSTYTYLTEYATLPEEPSYSQFSFFVFRVLLFPILLMNFIAINLRIWDAGRINYVFIFELDPRKHMSKHKFLEISLICYLLWISFVQFYIWTVVNDDRWHFNARPWLYPLILTGSFVLVLLFPHPAVFNGNARMWLLKKIFHCLIAPFATVRFADFWLADQLTSMSEFLFEVQFVFCILPSDFVSPLKTFCDQSQNLGVPVLNAWPLICRTLQCFRRYRDDPGKDKAHLWNAGKYGSSIFVMLWSFTQKSVIHALIPQLDSAAMWFFLVANVFSTCYKYYWDIVKDWGLFGFSKDVKYKGLRKEIVFNPILYYLAIILNLLLRFMWVLVFGLRLMANIKLDMQYFLFFVAFAEIFRRFVWNIFRLENEHLNNCGKFRAVLDIPLPFEAPPEEEQEDEMKEKNTKKKSFFVKWGLFKDSPLEQATSPKQRTPGTPTTISFEDVQEMPNVISEEERSRNPETFIARPRAFLGDVTRMSKSISMNALSRVRKSPSLPTLSSNET